MSEISELQRVIEEHIAVNDEEHASFAHMLQRLDYSIRGNGEPGLKQRVDQNYRRIMTLEEFSGELKAIRKWFMYGAAGLFATAVLQLLGWIGDK